MKDTEDNKHFEVLRSISKNPNASQRELAYRLGYSLGKLNYCLNSLRKKGLIKYTNFKNNKNKINYIYLLTPKGISEKTRLTLNFMRLKAKEYEDLKKELNIKIDEK